MAVILDFLLKTLGQVWLTFTHNWPFLLAGAVIAGILNVYVDQARVAGFLRRHNGASVFAATGAAVGTPLCSCGTTAVILGMMAGTAADVPWAPIVAFMVASPLTSPQELFYSAGLFGWPFAAAFFIASILAGLLGGLFAYALDSAGFLRGQARVAPPAAPVAAGPLRQVDLRRVAAACYAAGRQLLFFFFAFAFVGYALTNLIPSTWVEAAFGSGRVYGIPLAATLGVPFYVNTEASLPLVRAMLDAGMAPGAALAFLITGAGTSVGAIAGALTIARWRVVSLVLVTLWIAAVLCGFGYDALLALGAF